MIPTPDPLMPLSVMVVDDDPIYREYIRQTLEGLHNSEVALYTNGFAAMEHYDRYGADMIITDWLMPAMTGPELIRRIRPEGQPKAYPPYMVILTALDTPESRVHGLVCGADDFLTKPFVAEELLARCQIGFSILRMTYQLNYLASVDTGTGLWNRRMTLERLHECLRTQENTSVILVDVDHFKHINDTYGHSAGDQVLQLFGQFLLHHTRATDIVGRIGGEEFLIGVNVNSHKAYAIAERLRIDLERQAILLENPEQTIQIHASFGIIGTDMLSEKVALEAMIAYADRALYQAKMQGRNRCCLYSPALLPESEGHSSGDQMAPRESLIPAERQ